MLHPVGTLRACSAVGLEHSCASGAISDNFSDSFFPPSVLSCPLFLDSVDPLEGLTVVPSNNSDTGK